MPGPLSHIRVLDLTRVLAGPWCAQNLGDLGAEVIKVERPKKGDDSRAYGPPWIKDASGKDTAESAYFTSANRSKRSITVDIAKPAGAAIVRELAAKSDVLLENFKVGDLKRYKLAYDDLRQLNPRLIYCSITGFGQTGPYAEKAGYDFMVQGMGGFMSVTGERDDRPGGGPQRAGIPVVDIMTGMYATIAVCAAIAGRERTGKGQHLDIALLDTMVGFLANQGANFLATGKAPDRLGNTHPNIVPYQTFKTKDGDIIVACGNDNLFNKFAEVIGRPELPKEARFAKNADRVANRAEVDRVLAPIMLGRTTAEWVAALEAANVPCGPINTIAEVFDDPQVKARGMRIEIPHATAGTVPLIRSPMRFSETPIAHDRAPPTLGQHTAEILKGTLGKSDQEIAALRAEGIV